MFDPTEMTERHAAALAEFAEICLVSARDLGARQLAAEGASEAAEAAEAASALHKVGRSLRQSMALEAKFRRDLEQGVRDAEDRVLQTEQRRRMHRRAQLEAAFERLNWTEGFDYDADELSDVLDVDILAETFGQDPLDRHIIRLCKRLGLADPERLHRQEAGASEEARPPPPIEDDGRRSSA